MSVFKFHPRNHPQQVAAHGSTESSDNRATDPDAFAVWHARFDFTLDVAATDDNTKLPRHHTIATDGLSASWAGERVWCNPPYSRIRPWIEKAWQSIDDAELAVLLLPANRTEQDWWQDLVEPYRDQVHGEVRSEFLRGRLRFIAPGRQRVGPNERPPFGCVLLIFAADPCPGPRPDTVVASSLRLE